MIDILNVALQGGWDRGKKEKGERERGRERERKGIEREKERWGQHDF